MKLPPVAATLALAASNSSVTSPDPTSNVAVPDARTTVVASRGPRRSVTVAAPLVICATDPAARPSRTRPRCRYRNIPAGACAVAATSNATVTAPRLATTTSAVPAAASTTIGPAAPLATRTSVTLLPPHETVVRPSNSTTPQNRTRPACLGTGPSSATTAESSPTSSTGTDLNAETSTGVLRGAERTTTTLGAADETAIATVSETLVNAVPGAKSTSRSIPVTHVTCATYIPSLSYSPTSTHPASDGATVVVPDATESPTRVSRPAYRTPVTGTVTVRRTVPRHPPSGSAGTDT